MPQVRQVVRGYRIRHWRLVLRARVERYRTSIFEYPTVQNPSLARRYTNPRMHRRRVPYGASQGVGANRH